MSGVRIYQYNGKPYPVKLDETAKTLVNKIPNRYTELLRALLPLNDAAKDYNTVIQQVAEKNGHLIYPAYAYKVPIGTIVGDASISISATAFVVLFMEYRAIAAFDIKANLITAIDRLLSRDDVWAEYGGTIFADEDKDNLMRLKEALQKSKDRLLPESFRKLAESVVDENGVLKIMPAGEHLKDSDRDIISREKTVEVVEAMFELMMKGYYPLSISGIMPKSYVVYMPDTYSYSIDYIMPKDILEESNEQLMIESTNQENKLIPLYQGPVVDNNILWGTLEQRYKGIKSIYMAIRELLAKGYYDSNKYKYSQLYFAFSESVTQSTEDIINENKERFLDYFSSFIFGHVLNLFDTPEGEHVYCAARFVLDDVSIYAPSMSSYTRPLVSMYVQGDAVKFLISKDVKLYVGGIDEYSMNTMDVVEASYAVTAMADKGYDIVLRQDISSSGIELNEHVDIKVHIKESNPNEAGRYDYIIYDDSGESIELFSLNLESDTRARAEEPNE